MSKPEHVNVFYLSRGGAVKAAASRYSQVDYARRLSAADRDDVRLLAAAEGRGRSSDRGGLE
jgi:hypothetical protein